MISIVVSSFQIPIINSVKFSHLVSGDSEDISLHQCISKVVGIVKVTPVGMQI